MQVAKSFVCARLCGVQARRAECGMRYGAYHEGDLHVVEVAAPLLLRLQEQNTDENIKRECARWKRKRDAGELIEVKYDNEMLVFNDGMLRRLASSYERAENKKTALTKTGCTGLPAIARCVRAFVITIPTCTKVGVLRAHARV